MRRIGAALAFAAAVAASAAASAQPYQLTLAGASPGGLWSLLGVGVDRAVKASHPGSTVTYQTTGGGIANVGIVQSKKAELGIVHDIEMRLALNGEAPFKTPTTELRALAYLYDWAPMQLIIAKDFADQHGLKSFEDIAAKKPPLRVAINRRGNIANHVAEKMFEAAGFNVDDLKSWGGGVTFAASEEQSDLMKDRRVHAVLNSLFVGQRSLLEIGQALPVELLPIGEAVRKKVEASVGTAPFVIKAGSYPFQKADVPTVTLGAMLVAHQSLPEKDAHALTKALLERVEDLRGVHPSMKGLTPELMASQRTVPYHPGAVKAFAEKGLTAKSGS